jgi:D-amino peptidase
MTRCLLAACFLAGGAPLLAAAPVKLYVSADMEGVAGVVTGDQLGTTGFEYARFREFMTEEVNAALAAAREAGATEFVVADSHGNMQSLLPERLPSDVVLVRGTPRPQGMMQGLDATFAGVVFVGYHAGTTSSEGVRAHSFSSATLADVRLNGVSVPEGVWNAALAGHYGVPVLAMSGDDAVAREVKARLSELETAVVKWADGFHAARTLTPEAARTVIRETVRRAVARRADFRPYRLASPIEVELRFKNYRPSEVLSWLPGIRRADAHTVRFTARDMVEAYRFLQFTLNYQAALEP